MNRNPKDASPKFAPGQWVDVVGLSRGGQVMRVIANRGEAEVAINGVNLRLPIARLRPGLPPAEAPSPARSLPKTASPPQYQIDLHGKTVEEALDELDRFLDSAVVHRLSSVKIIHGHGTGRLRRGVREHLDRHPQVRDYRFGAPAQGGLAVTIAVMDV